VAAPEQPVQALLARLEQEADQLAQRITLTLRREIPAYVTVPEPAIVAGVLSDILASLAGQRAGRMPTEEELEIGERVGTERAAQGLPIEALLQAFRIGVRDVVARGRQLAPQLGVRDGAMIELIDQSWRWMDAVSVRAAKGHRTAELALLRSDVHRRAAFLHAALHGDLPLSELRAQADALGLGHTTRYAAVRARASEDMPAHRLQAIVAEAGAAPRELVGIVDGDVAGILLQTPTLPDSVICGLGPAVALERIADSYRNASDALTAALAFARPGVHTLEELTLESIVLDYQIGGVLERRCLDPLGANAETFVDSVRVFLESGMRYEVASARLVVHPNTLRYRLRRYEELTGLKLRRPGDLVATWIALERRRIRPERDRGPDLRRSPTPR
jgi:hypothetical protein